MGEAKQRKLLAEKSGVKLDEKATITQELKRRIDRGEPIEKTRKWFMKQDPVWNSSFADLDPLVQSFIIDMSADFRTFLARKESPGMPFEEVVRGTLDMVRGSGDKISDAAKPTIDRLTKLIEPEPAPRSWAKGAFTIFANDVECFSWAGTKQDAIEVQKRCLEICGALDFRSIPPDTYATQAASYLIAYGVPAVGDADHRPSGLFDPQPWSADEALCFRYSILRSALREHASNDGEGAGQRLEDIFAGKRFEIRFKGDRESHRASMARAQQSRGEGIAPDGEDTSIRMRTTELAEKPYLLDPQDAVRIPYADLLALAGRQTLTGDSPTRDSSMPETIYVPRIPIDAAEAVAMLRMTITVSAGASIPEARTYAGYTDAELAQTQ
jgi:hypothetical protein